MASFPVTNGVTTIVPPPEGYVVDFDNPQARNHVDHYFIFGVLGSLALFCLAQRLYTKQFIAGGLRVDDYLITLAWMASLVMQSVQIWSISIGGLCHHAWEMPIEVFEKHMLSSYIAAPVFITCNGLSKASLLTFYLRISGNKWFKVAIWTSIAMVASYTVVIAGLLLFGCQPLSASWDPHVIATGHCVDVAALYIAIAIANITSDIVIFIIPIPTVIGLKMPTVQKVGAGVMFGIGSVTVATSVVRMAYLPSLLKATDVPWVAAPANVWSFVEVNLFIICGSMPTFRKFLKRFAPKFLGTWGSNPSKSYAYDMSASKLHHRQQRTGYAQFDDHEMDRMSDKAGKGPRVLSKPTAAPGVDEPAASAGCKAQSHARDDTSEEAILDDKGITYTRTFHVEYSK